MAITRSKKYPGNAGPGTAADPAAGGNALPAARRRRIRVALLVLAAAVLLAGAATAGVFGYLTTAHG